MVFSLREGLAMGEQVCHVRKLKAAIIGIENSTDEEKKDAPSLPFKWSGSETVFPR